MSVELAPLQDTLLDDTTLQQLFADLRDHAQVLDIFVKGGKTQRASMQAITLPDALRAIRSSQVRAVQIRYLYQDQEWRDTLLAQGDAVRIVRTTVPAAGVATPAT